MVSLRLVVLLACFAGACGGRGGSRPVFDGGRDGLASPGGHTPVALRPRWIGVGDKFGLYVVRFDDALSPVTTILAWVDLPNRTPPVSQPAVVLPVQVEADAEVLEGTISWSKEGRHLVFATRQAKTIRLWVSSAENSFVPREIVFGDSDQLVARWISDETMVVAVVHDDQVDFARVSAPAWSVEMLGSYLGSAEAHAAANATFTVSRAGALYSLGSPDAGELWLVRDNEAPRHIGAALRRGALPCQYDLSWSLDGQSAVWWGRTRYDSSSAKDLGCQSAPALDIVPGAIPAMSVEVRATQFFRQSVSDPARGIFGNSVDWSLIWSPVAGAPVGPAIAYGICSAHSSTGNIPRDETSLGIGTLVVKGDSGDGGAPVPPRETKAVVCEARVPRFGFINASDYYFTRQQTFPDGRKAVYEFVINRQGQDEVVGQELSSVLEAGVFARGRRLFYAATDASGQALWSVDLTAAKLTAERVALAVGPEETLVDGLRPGLYPSGSIPYLRSSEVLGGRDQSDEPMFDSPDREALLVGIQESPLTPCEASPNLCSRWVVVNFDAEPAVVPLDSAWRAWDLTWTPDGQGLIAAGKGVYWLTGPGYQDRYRLFEEHRGLFVPPRWPAP